MWRFVVAVLLATDTEAFVPVAPAPIRWGAAPGNRLVLAPLEVMPNKAAHPQQLRIANANRISKIPYFAANPDNTIAWDSTELCIEASDITNGAAVSLNHCTGNAGQLWNLLPYGREQMNSIQLQGTNMCIDVDDMDGGSVELAECSEGDESEAWRFEPDSRPFSMRLAMIWLSSIAALGLIPLSAWLWRELKQARMVENHRRGDMQITGDAGGVCLTSTLPLRQGLVRVIPDSFLSLDDPILRDGFTPRELEDMVPAVLALNPQLADAVWDEGKSHRFVTEEVAANSPDDDTQTDCTCKTGDQFEGTREDGAYPGSSRIHFTLPGRDDEEHIVELLRTNERDNPAFAAVAVKLPLDITVEACSIDPRRMVVSNVKEQSHAEQSRIMKGDIIRAVSVPEIAVVQKKRWWGRRLISGAIGRNKSTEPMFEIRSDAEEGMLILDDRSPSEFSEVIQENLAANGENSEVVLLIERPFARTDGEQRFSFWDAWLAPFQRPALANIPMSMQQDSFSIPFMSTIANNFGFTDGFTDSIPRGHAAVGKDRIPALECPLDRGVDCEAVSKLENTFFRILSTEPDWSLFANSVTLDDTRGTSMPLQTIKELLAFMRELQVRFGLREEVYITGQVIPETKAAKFTGTGRLCGIGMNIPLPFKTEVDVACTCQYDDNSKVTQIHIDRWRFNGKVVGLPEMKHRGATNRGRLSMEEKACLLAWATKALLPFPGMRTR